MPDIEPDEPSSDAELLRRYRSGSDEPAFAALVARHGGWIYASALRRVRDAHVAEDVAQAVLLALAKDAPFLNDASMAAWLFRVTHYASSAALRSAARRRHYEADAARNSHDDTMQTDEADDVWRELVPHLERAVDRLGHRDRATVLLRFYQQKSFHHVAAALGISEVSARRRVSRAIGKLRDMLSRDGVLTASADTLSASLLAHATTALPRTMAEQWIKGIARGGSQDVELARVAMHNVRRAMMARSAVAVLSLVAVIGIAIRGSRAIAGTRMGAARPAVALVAQPIDRSIEAIIAKIKAAERGIEHLYIGEFETTYEESADGQRWTETEAKDAGFGWFDESPNGRARLHLTQWIAPWAEGAAPWYESSLAASWDGEEGRSVEITGGPLGRALPDASAIRTNQPPPIIGESHGWTHLGLGFSLQYGRGQLVGAARHLLSEQLETARQMRATIAIDEETANELPCVRIRAEAPVGAQAGSYGRTYWLAIDRNFAIVKYEEVSVRRDARRVQGFDVLELLQAAPGIWFPSHARAHTIKMMLDQPDVHMRTTFRAKEVIANDKQWDDRVFSVAIPRGYMVTDQRDGHAGTYLIDDNGDELPLHQGDVVPRARRQEVIIPDASGRLR